MRGRIAADLGDAGKLNDKPGEWWRLPNVIIRYVEHEQVSRIPFQPNKRQPNG